MQKKENPDHLYLTFFTARVTGNPKYTIIFLGLVCMYLLPHVCIKNIFDLLMVEKKLDSLLTARQNSSYLIGGVMVSILAGVRSMG
jgi:hypothetical protein